MRATIVFAEAAKLTGAAAEWFAPFVAESGTAPFPTLSALQAAMTATWVGKDPYDLLSADLYSRTLVSFSSWTEFRAWFVRTAAGLRECNPAGREWTDVPLVDRFIAAVNGTRYYEGVVTDPDTGERPATMQRTLHLADERHNVLLHRNQAYDKRAKSGGVGKGGSGGGGPGGDTSGGGGAGGSGGGQGGGHSGGGKNRGKGAGSKAKLLPNKKPTKKTGDRAGPGPVSMAQRLAKHCGVSPELAAQRMEKNVCVKCGQPGHRSMQCPDDKGKGPASN
jgi:hypothetical protein